MYPLLLGFEKEPNITNVLRFVVENIGDTVVKNGEFIGENIKDALSVFGKDAFGQNGINTVIFRSGEEKSKLISKLNQNENLNENPDDTVIYPFGVVNSILNDDDLTVETLSLNGKAGIYEENSFLIIFVKENDCLVSDFDSTMKAQKNNAVFVPAKTRIELLGEADLILIHK